MISSSQRPLPDNTQHSQQTNIHASGGIRTHDLSRRTAADLRLRPRGHWNRLKGVCTRTRYQIKDTLVHAMECFVGVEVQRHSFVTSALYAVCINCTPSLLYHLYSLNRKLREVHSPLERCGIVPQTMRVPVPSV